MSGEKLDRPVDRDMQSLLERLQSSLRVAAWHPSHNHHPLAPLLPAKSPLPILKFDARNDFRTL